MPKAMPKDSARSSTDFEPSAEGCQSTLVEVGASLAGSFGVIEKEASLEHSRPTVAGAQSLLERDLMQLEGKMMVLGLLKMKIQKQNAVEEEETPKVTPPAAVPLKDGGE